MSNQSILQNPPECEYPTEFLVARLQGKKSRLFQNWDELLSRTDLKEFLDQTPLYPYLSEYGNPGTWRFLNAEYQWVFLRMNHGLRELFAPYFIFQQIEILRVCFRHLYRRTSPETLEQYIDSSLLNKDLQKILTSTKEFSEIIQSVETELVAVSTEFVGLGKEYNDKGFQALELFLTECFLRYIQSLQADRVLATFLHMLVDHYNCMTLAKAIHWKQRKMPKFLPNGSVAIDQFERSFSRNDPVQILKLFHLGNIQQAQASAAVLETFLLRHLTKTIRTWSRFRSATAYILFYLWEQFRYTRNISMILHTVSLDDELVSEHIII